MIVAAAIKTQDGKLFVGKRHNNCITNAFNILMALETTGDNAKNIIVNSKQGFLTDKGEFLTREEAYKHAQEAKQTNLMRVSHVLTSEDLW